MYCNRYPGRSARLRPRRQRDDSCCPLQLKRMSDSHTGLNSPPHVPRDPGLDSIGPVAATAATPMVVTVTTCTCVCVA
ncbi:hypothetical protein AAHC03_01182 [Spirometra sp. Aus1]